MGQVLLLLVVALTVAAVVFGVTVLVTGSDPGLGTAEPDGRAVPLPGNRPLLETDVGQVRFDLALRGYRMAQVDQALRRTAYDIGYKDELIGVLQAEVTALREGRLDDADVLRRAREAALVPVGSAGTAPEGALDGSSARALAAAATTGGIGGHSSPVPPVDGPADAAGGTSGSGERPGPPEPAPLDLPQRAFRADPSTRSDPAAAQPAASSTDERADEGTDERAAERADDAGATVRARSVREGGSVIEAEDGDLTEPAASVRPAVGAEPAEPTSVEPTSTAATGDDPTTGNGDDRPTRADAPAGSGSAAAGSDASAGSGSAAAGPSEPAEQPERA